MSCCDIASDGPTVCDVLTVLSVGNLSVGNLSVGNLSVGNLSVLSVVNMPPVVGMPLLVTMSDHLRNETSRTAPPYG